MDVILSFLVIHVGALFGFWYFTWSALFAGLAIWVIVGSVGICIGYHRLLTHGSFKTSAAVRYALTLVGTLANEGPPLMWVGTHRMHHQNTDQAGDPHSPVGNFSWGHIGWTFFFEHEGARKYAQELTADRGLMLIERFYFVPPLVLAAALYAIGGMPWLIWGFFARSVATWHCTWFVNSVGHRYGYRNFETKDHSCNSWWVALLTFGEGWHNNHHAFPASARHGLKWWEFDQSYLIIWLMAKVGLVWDVRVPQDAQIAAKEVVAVSA
jgi:stearoyl-CoA desaturase (delta-9 desaturase)